MLMDIHKGGKFFLDMELSIDGKPWDGESAVADTASVRFIAGVVVDQKGHAWTIDKYSRKWRREQQTVTALVEVPQDKWEELKVFLQQARGKIL